MTISLAGSSLDGRDGIVVKAIQTRDPASTLHHLMVATSTFQLVLFTGSKADLRNLIW